MPNIVSFLGPFVQYLISFDGQRLIINKNRFTVYERDGYKQNLNIDIIFFIFWLNNII